MKKLILLFFLINTLNLVGQENELKKHSFSFGVGVGHSKKWKDIYVPAKYNQTYVNQSILTSGYVRKPNFNFEIGFSYKRILYKKISMNLKLNYSNTITHRVYNSDTLRKYFFFPDSIDLFRVSKRKYNFINIIPSIEYKYKRFGIGVGYLFNIILLDNYYYEYENKPNYNKINVKWFDYFIPTVKLSYDIIKKNRTITVFFETAINQCIGLELLLNK